MDTIERTARSAAQSLPSLPLRLHHHAYVVKDHEANRRFLEDLLGIPLVATWCERSARETGDEVEYCHTFFGLADGGAWPSSSSPTRRCTRRRRRRSRPRSAATTISR